MKANKIDRGDLSEAFTAHMSECNEMEVRQTLRGWCGELFGIEARDEFKYYIGGQQVFHSLEDSDFASRCLCEGCYEYKMVVTELDTESEIITIDRPKRCCLCCCKRGSYQEASISSNGVLLGKIKENNWYCVPSFHVYTPSEEPMYLIHHPTCCYGMCINCCSEGNPCGKGCCKESLRVYAPWETNTRQKDPYLGIIRKKPKNLASEIFTDAVAMKVHFPKNATLEQKGILMGTSVFLNSILFEGQK